jgi:hypothetical protein
MTKRYFPSFSKLNNVFNIYSGHDGESIADKRSNGKKIRMLAMQG